MVTSARGRNLRLGRWILAMRMFFGIPRRLQAEEAFLENDVTGGPTFWTPLTDSFASNTIGRDRFFFFSHLPFEYPLNPETVPWGRHLENSYVYGDGFLRSTNGRTAWDILSPARFLKNMEGAGAPINRSILWWGHDNQTRFILQPHLQPRIVLAAVLEYPYKRRGNFRSVDNEESPGNRFSSFSLGVRRTFPPHVRPEQRQRILRGPSSGLVWYGRRMPVFYNPRN